jgi:hypothetical protein
MLIAIQAVAETHVWWAQWQALRRMVVYGSLVEGSKGVHLRDDHGKNSSKRKIVV